MHVEHFNPKKKRDKIQEYTNLFLATAHCNSAKGDRWPNSRDSRNGLRFLNCCKEEDYGVHIFEDPDDHKVVGITPQGRYHVRYLDLNAKQLVHERALRAKIWAVLREQWVTIPGDYSLPDQYVLIKAIAEEMIPEIPYLIGTALQEWRAIKKEMAESS